MNVTAAYAPTVSVVIPVFNRPVAVRRAIESVLAQTCQDFEIIVVDDGSTDETSATLAALTDPRITVHPSRDDARRKRGPKHRDRCQLAAPFVAFLDSDDEWLPAKLERQLEVIARSGPEVALVYTGTERNYSDGSRIVHIPAIPVDPARALLTQNVIGGTSVGMVRRSALDIIGGFDETFPASQEMDLWLRLCERFRAVLVPEVLVRVDMADDSNRITGNIASTTRGRELFRRKHRARMIDYSVLHLHLCESGWWYLQGARDTAAARRCALEAIASHPLAFQPYALLLAAAVPLAWLDRLANLKHHGLAFQRRHGCAERGQGSAASSRAQEQRPQ